MRHILLAFMGIALGAACTTTKNEAEATDLAEATSEKTELVTVSYQCDEGAVVTVEYENHPDPKKSVAYVQLNPENPEKIKMTISQSASGARYTDGKLVWWTKGKTAFLAEEGAVETPIHDNCNEFQETEP